MTDQLTPHVLPTPDTTGSVVSGAPLSTIADLICGPHIDDMLRRAAIESPDQLALRDRTGEITFAELDAQVDACASALRQLVARPPDGSRTVVGITADLDISYAVLFFGVSRAGMVSALISPLLRSEQLLHVMRTTGVAVVFASAAIGEELAALRDRLPMLTTVVPTHASSSAPSAESLDSLIAAYRGHPAPEPADTDTLDVACLQFTNGSTGALKAVRLSHRNLTVNAAQTAHACDLDPGSVLFNNLPTFHLMHLVAAVTARASHVLDSTGNVLDAVEQAALARATHFYSLPMRLITLAGDARLGSVELPSLRVVMSGGSTMPPHATTALSQQLGVPAIQGYGLAEASPIIACDTPARPRERSCGRPVAGASVRVVDTSSRQVVPRGERGEIEISGPQLMLGYLGRDRGLDFVDDTWFPTGDVGYLDADGYLFIVDRIKDVFKCDNWLVSPTEIERVLLRHPGVADAVVIDYPHAASGAVPYAVVVPRSSAVTAESIQDFVAAKLPYYDHVRAVEFAESIPRSANGAKVLRRTVRERVHAAAALDAGR